MSKEHVREFPWQRMINDDYSSIIPRAADGSPYGDLYVESRAFDTFLYRTEPLTVVKEFEEIASISEIEHKVKKPRAVRLMRIYHSQLPKEILKGTDMTISVISRSPIPERDSPEPSQNIGLRNGDANELYFVHEGKGVFCTDFGTIEYEKGDYVFLPRGTTYTIDAHYTSENIESGSFFAIAEIPKPVFMPRHSWLSDFFPYDPSAITSAIPYSKKDITERKDVNFETFLKTNGSYNTKLVHPFAPFNCTGWQGKLYPFKLSMKHIHTLSSPTFHLPPTALVTFTTEDMGAMISTFKPRWIHSLPYNHMNDHDEFLFYHRGEYSARTGIKLGDATLHPAGVHHGPQPKRMKEWKRSEPKDLPWREETAVMFESRAPFSMTSQGKAVELEGYDESWEHEWEETNGDASDKSAEKEQL